MWWIAYYAAIAAGVAVGAIARGSYDAYVARRRALQTPSPTRLGSRTFQNRYLVTVYDLRSSESGMGWPWESPLSADDPVLTAMALQFRNFLFDVLRPSACHIPTPFSPNGLRSSAPYPFCRPRGTDDAR